MQKKFNLLFFSIVGVVWLLDFLSKQWALSKLAGQPYQPILGEYLGLELTFNTGGIFGIFQGNAMFFHIMTGVAILFLLVYYARGVSAEENTRLFQVAMAMVLGGALGNFTDRFYQEGVVDFINMGIGPYRWPTYNVADAFISTGALFFVLSFIQYERRKKRSGGGS
ncbi:MAG: signal peptidase II [Leptospiraceae bacterium]|nr:signal peptidase II [Leptospiraceae bacterium]MDW8306158.1 signal peptidase II [Leptospiraceae bacterium]